jgi:hypothetical protein
MNVVRFIGLVTAVMALAFGDALASEPAQAAGARLSIRQVSDLAATAFQKNGVRSMHFRANEPKFLSKSHVWLVFYIQDTPPYVPDGDMLVIVNDRTRRACVQQAMMPPRPCE